MEEFDLFDKNRKSLGVKLARNSTIPENCYRQVVHIAMFNSEKKMLIQKRTNTKSLFPGLWDISVGGGVISGETPYDAASRELSEELGIKFDFSDVRPMLTINYERGFDDFFVIEMDVNLSELSLQPEEVSEVKWADLSEVKKLKESGEFIPFCSSFIELLFYYGSGHRDIW